MTLVYPCEWDIAKWMYILSFNYVLLTLDLLVPNTLLSKLNVLKAQGHAFLKRASVWHIGKSRFSGECGVLWELGQYDLIYTYEAIMQA